ncbi:MAG: DUF1217 domain-containing protein [Hyphomicrobiaceae bacterium]|nr:DUF1217 domain-containing protein [Hyphomicrobiaceae bacterium]
MIASDLARSLGAAARKPEVARETAHYLANIGKVRTIEDLLADDRIFAYAMKAFGLEDMTYAKALMRKVLAEGIDDRQSIANGLADSRYREFAEAFNFARHGVAATSFQKAQQGAVDRYLRQRLEQDAGAQNEGVRLALYFQRKAPGISSVYAILGDRALLDVARTALGLSPAIAMADIDRQAEAIAERLAIGDLKDPGKLQRFLDRFMAHWDLSRPSTQPHPAAILAGRPVEAGIGPDLLASLQRLKPGGH